MWKRVDLTLAGNQQMMHEGEVSRSGTISMLLKIWKEIPKASKWLPSGNRKWWRGG